MEHGGGDHDDRKWQQRLVEIGVGANHPRLCKNPSAATATTALSPPFRMVAWGLSARLEIRYDLR
jgi:hypothetical protein